MLSDSREMLAWDVYFGGLVSIQFHPANPPETRLPLAYLGEVADLMMLERSKRCQSLPPQP